MARLEFMPLPLPISVTLSCGHQGIYSSSPLKTIPGHTGATALRRLLTAVAGAGRCFSTLVQALPRTPTVTASKPLAPHLSKELSMFYFWDPCDMNPN